jgi:arylsulfatase A-like enzyme
MIFVWPGRIPAGLRFSDPVSMIDMLPTVLELAGLPMPEIMQGQSLAPILLGREGWEPQLVIFDQFNVERGIDELRGTIDVIDGRWGASLEINQNPEEPQELRRPVPLLLFDLWNDPWCLRSLHEEHPDLVEKYTRFLQAKWKEHRELAKQFKRSKDSPLTSEQLRTLRSLGYIK